MTILQLCRALYPSPEVRKVGFRRSVATFLQLVVQKGYRFLNHAVLLSSAVVQKY